MGVTLLDYAEAAELLGVSVVALRQKVFRAVIPLACIVRQGNRVRFRKPELVAWARARQGIVEPPPPSSARFGPKSSR